LLVVEIGQNDVARRAPVQLERVTAFAAVVKIGEDDIASIMELSDIFSCVISRLANKLGKASRSRWKKSTHIKSKFPCSSIFILSDHRAAVQEDERSKVYCEP
jgi:hypothetical protein